MNLSASSPPLRMEERVAEGRERRPFEGQKYIARFSREIRYRTDQK